MKANEERGSERGRERTKSTDRERRCEGGRGKRKRRWKRKDNVEVDKERESEHGQGRRKSADGERQREGGKGGNGFVGQVPYTMSANRNINDERRGRPPSHLTDDVMIADI